MKPASYISTFLVLLLGGCSATNSNQYAVGSVADYEYIRPAKLKESPGSLAESIVFPDSQGDINLSINCSTRISSSGWARSKVVCYDYKDELADYYHAIAAAFPGKYLVPAQLNDRRVRLTKFYFTVNFTAFGGVRKVNVYENLGMQTDSSVGRFISPQRYRFRYSLNRQPRCKNLGQAYANFVFTVDVSGHAKDVFSPAREQMGDFCFEDIKNIIERSRYIPALLDHTPVEAIYVQTYTSTDYYTSIDYDATVVEVDQISSNSKIQNGKCGRLKSRTASFCFLPQPLIVRLNTVN